MIFSATSNSLTEYATPEEIAALEAALRERWKQLGKELSGKDAGDETGNLKSDRSSIKWALALIGQGELPRHLDTFSEAEDILAPFHERYEAAKFKLRECTLLEIERTLIDDDAWNAELHRRKMVEQRRKQRGFGVRSYDLKSATPAHQLRAMTGPGAAAIRPASSIAMRPAARNRACAGPSRGLQRHSAS